jgi:hypothetical protein
MYSSRRRASTEALPASYHAVSTPDGETIVTTPNELEIGVAGHDDAVRRRGGREVRLRTDRRAAMRTFAFSVATPPRPSDLTTKHGRASK